MNTILKKISSRFDSKEAVRYVVAGVATTMVNLLTFAVLRYGLKLGLTPSNFVAISLAIIFAFFANKYYAFQSQTKKKVQIVTEFVKFVGGRLITMFIEIVGVYIIAVWMGLPDMVAKLFTQVIVMVVNYLISKLFVFKKQEESTTIVDWAKENAVYIMAFVIPAAIFTGVCIRFKVTPFGGQTLMIIDSLHQYLPFFSEYYDKLTQSGEFLYSWNGAMGYNFLTLWAYYLSSPFNLLILLFSKIHINMAMTLIIGLKISCCSLTMTYYLTKRSGKKDSKAVMLGLCYAFSNYVIGYYWNIMWLDVLLLAPLVVLGLEWLIQKKDCRMYVVTLFMALFCNFYISFMLCIFLVLWFLVYPHKNVKEFFLSGVRFALSSILSAAMAAFVLIPTYYGIMLTGPADSEFPKSSWYGSVIDILKKFCVYSGSITNQSEDGGVNLYCGMLVVFLTILYFCIKEVSWGQKIKRLLLLVFFVLSFNNTVLNYIWHGFHDQFGIPNRFSFLMIFTMIVMAYEVLQHISTISFWKYFIPLGFLLAFVLYNNEVKALFEEKMVVRAVMIAMVCYFMAFMFYVILEWKERTLCLVLCGIVLIEICANTVYSFKGNGQITIKDYFGDSPKMWKAARSVEDGTFYREELSRNNLVDENFWLNLKSVGIFGSTANGDAVTLLGKMGFYTAANEHLYNGATPLTDSLFGVKYLYKRAGDYFDHGFELYKNVDGVEIYKNPYALSLGYMVNSQITNWDYQQYEPADDLNDFVNKATSVQDKLFTPIADDFLGSGENCDVVSNGTGDGTYAYSRTTDGELTVTLTLTAQDSTPMYIRATGTDLSGIEIAINGEVQCSGRYFFQLVPVGNTKAGDQVTVKYTFTGSQADDQTVNLKAYTFNEQAFSEVYQELSKQQLKITQYTSSSIEGTIDVKENGMMMTSIINEPGWKVYVDGKEQKITEIGDSFVAVALTAGKHKIRIRFVPKTLPMATGIAVAAFAVFFGYTRYRKKAQYRAQTTVEE